MAWSALRSFTVAALLGAACGSGAAAQSASNVRLTSGEWQPYLSRKMPQYGAASQILTEAFAAVGVRVEYGFFPWTRAMKLAREGRWDGTAIWWDSKSRRKSFYFTDPIIPSKTAFFYLKGKAFDWSSYKDLAKLKVGGTAGYFYGKKFADAERSGLIRTVRTRSDEIGLTNLLKGRIDVFPGEIVVTYFQIRNTFGPKDAKRFTHHPNLIRDEPLYLLLSRKVPGMVRMRDRFNQGLRQLKHSGRYKQILSNVSARRLAKPK
jgi:polar amino acid transport system substrate-binding protein